MEQVLYKLPDGWEWMQLGEALDVRDGTHDSPKYVESGFPLVTSKNITGKGLDVQNVKYISKEDYDAINKRSKVDVGDILFAMIGTIGFPTVITDEPNYAIKNVALFKKRQDDQNMDFFKYFLESPYAIESMLAQAKGAAQKFVGLKVLRSFNVPLPPKVEQKRIVEKLDALLTRIDTAIEYLQESVTLKNNLLQSALDGQFAVIAERTTIESLAEVKGGKRLPKGQKLSDEETEHPYIRVADFTDKGSIDLSGIKYISKGIHEQIKHYVISKEDLYISIAGTIGKTGFVPPELDGANLTENAAKLVIKDKQRLDLSYLYLFTLTSDFSAQAGLATKTVAQPKLALTRLSKIEIPMCSLEEQKSLVSTIEALKSKIHDAEAVLLGEIEDLKSLKASILDSAFKGEL